MAERELPGGTVTFMLTDVEGSTSALHRLGPRYAESLALHRRLVREAASRAGVEVDTQGDSFLFAFAGADDALDAAEALTVALAEAEWPEGVVLAARIGIHTGSAERTPEGYVGIELHRAARIAACAHGGQVVASASTQALARDRPFVDLGRHRLKDFADPEQLFQLPDPLGRSFPPLRSQVVRPLPRLHEPLIGRAAELGAVRALLDDGVRLVTLTGAGGVGKSRLALELAHDEDERFAHGAHLARLAPLGGGDDVLAEIASAVGATPGEDPLGATSDHLRERHLLLVLDNVEHVRASAAPAIAALLDAAPRLVVLATSRSPLRLHSEHVVTVQPLPESDAVRLFAARARSADGTFSLDAGSETHVLEICRRVDCLPLAIEIAAARVLSVAVADMSRGIGLSLRTAGADDAPDRHRTLAAAIAWGTGILDERLRGLHASLGVFRGSFTPEAAAVAFEATSDELDELVRAALLRRVDDGGGTTRLGMLQTIREFAREQLVAEGRPDEARERRALWIELLAERAAAGLDHGDPGPWLAELEHWAPDVRATLRAAAATGDNARCIRIAAALERYWRAHGEVGEALSLLTAALAAAAPDDVAARARASWTIARLALAQGDPAAARPYLLDALELYTSIGATRETAFALAELAWLALDQGDLRDAEERATAALALGRSAGDDRATAGALGALAAVASEHGDTASARAWAEESLAARRLQGDRQLVANAAFVLGSAALADGDLDAAATALAECLALAEDLHDRLHEAGARCGLGQVAALRGEQEEARSHLIPAAGAFLHLGNDAAVGECLVALALVEEEQATAGRLLDAALAARAQHGVSPLPAEVRIERLVRERLGDAGAGLGRPGAPSLRDAAALAGVDPTAG